MRPSVLLIAFASGHPVKAPKNHNRWIPAYLMRETEEKHDNEDGTEKTDPIEKRTKDKCDERAE